MVEVFSYKAVTKDKFWKKTYFPGQIIKPFLAQLLSFINLKKCIAVAMRKLQEHQTEIPKKTQVSSWKKSKKCWSKSLNHMTKI